MNFSRVEWKHLVQDGKYKKVPKMREDNWVWSPQGIIDMHRPEMWGYVQFSDGKTATRFRPDPSRSARVALMSVYHHQKSFVRKHKKWAGSLEELGLAGNKWKGLTSPPKIERTGSGYQATAAIKTAAGRTRRFQVRSDSRLTEID